jgi:hypothetical protein
MSEDEVPMQPGNLRQSVQMLDSSTDQTRITLKIKWISVEKQIEDHRATSVLHPGSPFPAFGWIGSPRNDIKGA